MSDGEEFTDYENLCNEFYFTFKRCIAASEILDAQLISQAARSGTWVASAWRLERSLPDRYSSMNREFREAQKNLLDLEKRVNSMVTRDEELVRLRQAEHEREQVIADLQRQLAEFRDGTAK